MFICIKLQTFMATPSASTGMKKLAKSCTPKPHNDSLHSGSEGLVKAIRTSHLQYWELSADVIFSSLHFSLFDLYNEPFMKSWVFFSRKVLFSHTERDISIKNHPRGRGRAFCFILYSTSQ